MEEKLFLCACMAVLDKYPHFEKVDADEFSVKVSRVYLAMSQAKKDYNKWQKRR